MPDDSIWSPPHPRARVHLAGICGAGMKAMAEFLSDRGWTVSGCDGDPDPETIGKFQQRGVSVQTGHSTTHLSEPPDLLIFSAAIPTDNPEIRQAEQLGIPRLSYVEALAQLSRHAPTLAISGTHGKSTTTAMVGQILRSSGRPSSLICGAESLAASRSGWGDSQDRLVVEACEFRRHFLSLSLETVCILGIEPDHFDCYPNIDDAVDAYRELACQIRPNSSGQLIVRSDCPNVSRLLQQIGITPVTFSLSDESADWGVVDRVDSADGSQFRIRHLNDISPPVRMRMPGWHHIQNAVAAAACAGAMGVNLTEIANGLSEFQGLKRRFETVRTIHGAPIIDDYAHHPTEIRAAIAAARQAWPGRKLICYFQPHQMSRTAALLPEFAEALNLADQAYVLPVYAARESGGIQQSELSRQIVRQMTTPATFLTALDRVRGTIQTDANTDVVILTLGAGNLTRIHHDDVD